MGRKCHKVGLLHAELSTEKEKPHIMIGSVPQTHKGGGGKNHFMKVGQKSMGTSPPVYASSKRIWSDWCTAVPLVLVLASARHFLGQLKVKYFFHPNFLSLGFSALLTG